MKIVLAVIAALGTIGAFSESAIADVSISIRFGSSPTYSSYRSNVWSTYPNVPYHPNNYDHHHRNNSSVIVRKVYPASPYYRSNWNYIVPSTVIRRSNIYEHHYNNYGDRYIIQRSFIRIR